MEINKEWFKKDFKQIFCLLCRESKFEVKKFAQLKNKDYICKRGIKIEEL